MHQLLNFESERVRGREGDLDIEHTAWFSGARDWFKIISKCVRAKLTYIQTFPHAQLPSCSPSFAGRKRKDHASNFPHPPPPPSLFFIFRFYRAFYNALPFARRKSSTLPPSSTPACASPSFPPSSPSYLSSLRPSRRFFFFFFIVSKGKATHWSLLRRLFFLSSLKLRSSCVFDQEEGRWSPSFALFSVHPFAPERSHASRISASSGRDRFSAAFSTPIGPEESVPTRIGAAGIALEGDVTCGGRRRRRRTAGVRAEGVKDDVL